MKTQLYRHILVATDLSTHTNNIMKRAVEMRELSAAKLSLVHVLAHASIAYAGEFSIPIDAEYQITLKNQAQSQLLKIAKKYDISEKSLHLVEGSVKLAVTDLAKEIHADLIVLGTHAHEGLEVLLGSQVNAILHAAPCDVWVIRAGKQ